MRFYSTKNHRFIVSLREAVLRGLAPDGGLFMPIDIPVLKKNVLEAMPEMSFAEIAFEMASVFLKDDLSSQQLTAIVEKALNFDVPLHPLTDDLFVLELFHGPTLAFKDFGARFMARLMARFVEEEEKEVTILVATSGDTGSAVASGFLGLRGFRVVLLYPSGMVSEIQEKQLTTIGGNVTALEVDGSFDDCQRLVKNAFVDEELKKAINLSSANSINIARLIPQSFYYAYAWAQLPKKNSSLAVSVPSGNLGNLTAGLFARAMGIPIKRFVAAMNANDVFLEYLRKGTFTPRQVIPTLSNAMDVGNPSNLYRILDLFDGDAERIRKVVYGASFDDQQTREAISMIKKRYDYLMDPHGAVGFLALRQFVEETGAESWQKIVLETAHPAKFRTAVEECTGEKVPIPERLAECLKKEKFSIKISNKYEEFKQWLTER